MPYKEGNQEIYFLRQYDADGFWDGNCIINVYENNCLTLITEAVYNSGKLKSYKQLLQSESNYAGDTWTISKRVCKGKVNKGDSCSFYRKAGHKKKFTLKNVKVSDMLTIESITSTISLEMECFYHGNTSNGKYNDNTGKAYMIKYFVNGTVRMLYRGRFKDGLLNDESNKAWYIVKDKNTNYMYYRGTFANNTSKNKDAKNYTFDLTLEQIKEITKDYKFTQDLKWDF